MRVPPFGGGGYLRIVGFVGFHPPPPAPVKKNPGVTNNFTVNSYTGEYCPLRHVQLGTRRKLVIDNVRSRGQYCCFPAVHSQGPSKAHQERSRTIQSPPANNSNHSRAHQEITGIVRSPPRRDSVFEASGCLEVAKSPPPPGEIIPVELVPWQMPPPPPPPLFTKGNIDLGHFWTQTFGFRSPPPPLLSSNTSLP